MSEKIVQLNEAVIKNELKELVRGSVEETLNELLETEAQKLTQAARYERNEQRQGYRSGHYSRNLTTTSGDVTLKVPKLKGISFETAIIERYRRRESSVEEALIEMYLAGVSVRRIRKRMSTLRTGGTALCKVGAIRMSMWMGSTCAATGAESLKMWPFWWQLRSMRMDTARFWAPLRA